MLAEGIGHDMPRCPVSIRAPMNPGGTAGAPLAPGEIGEVCFTGPQLFLGYLADPEATARALSSDGVLYTGDLGTYGPSGLRLAGRVKLTVKPKGFQVYPGDVENHVLSRLDGKATGAACVGAEHAVWVEAIVLFVEAAADGGLTPEEVREACAGMASYARPSHVEVLAPGTLPQNRVAKTDYLALKARAAELVVRLRAEGGWDARA
jgi:acyl-CoA synthetase (AMP-forming)/AMP-acid ligase II